MNALEKIIVFVLPLSCAEISEKTGLFLFDFVALAIIAGYTLFVVVRNYCENRRFWIEVSRQADEAIFEIKRIRFMKKQKDVGDAVIVGGPIAGELRPRTAEMDKFVATVAKSVKYDFDNAASAVDAKIKQLRGS